VDRNSEIPRSRLGRWGGQALLKNVLVICILLIMVVPPASTPGPILGTGAPSRTMGTRTEVYAATVTPASPSLGMPYVNDTLVLSNNTLVPGNFFAGNNVYPFGVAYDRGKGEVFVSSENSAALTVINDSTASVTTSIPVGVAPVAVTYDSAKGELFTADDNSADMSVVSDSTNRMVDKIIVGVSPTGVAYDSGKGEVFLTNMGSNVVNVINDTTNSPVATIHAGSWTWGVAYDSAKGEIYVSNDAGNNVSVLSDSTNSVVANIPVDAAPQAVAYDSGMGEIFVVNMNSNDVTVINDTTNKALGSIFVGHDPSAIAYDRKLGELFVTNEGTYPSFQGTVSVISDASKLVIATVPVGSYPEGIAFDDAKGEAFVSNIYSNNVSVVSAATNTVVKTISVGIDPRGLAYDSAKRELFATNTVSDNVTVISTVTNKVVAWVPVGPYPQDATYDSGKGEVFVVNLACTPYCSQQGNVSIISDATNMVVASVSVGSSPSRLAYDSGKGEVFVANGVNVSVISDTTNSIVAVIPGLGGLAMAYDSAKGEMFIANYNNVSVVNDTTNTVVTNITVGTNPAGMAYDSGKGEMFVTNMQSNNVSVISDTTNKVVATVLGPIIPYAIAYDSATGELFATESSFSEANVSVISDSTNTLVAKIPVGMDSEGAAYDPVSGEVYVSNYCQGTISIISTGPRPTAYPVSFDESGLPTGANWSVTLNGILGQSSGTTITFSEINGTYPWSLTSISGYHANLYSGNVIVNGAGKSVSVVWSRVTYDVAFTEVGLLSGTGWWVNISGGQSTHSAIPTLSFKEPNGTYNYSVASGNREYSSPGGAFTVKGASLSSNVTFTLVTYAVAFTEHGLATGTNWTVTLGGTPRSSTTPTVLFTEPNGTCPWALTPIAGYHASAYIGNVTVNGTSSSVTISWSEVIYPVTFTEVGLSAGTSWYVNLTEGSQILHQASTGNTIAFNVTNGTYNYVVDSPIQAAVTITGLPPLTQYIASEISGIVTVSGSSPAPIPITYITQYLLMLTGFPSGSGTVSPGITYESESAVINITAVPASHNYVFSSWSGICILPVSPYLCSGSYSGTNNPASVIMNGAVLENATFALKTYTVTFTEAGLPTGTDWSVTMGGTGNSSTGSTITFTEPNGNYSYTVVPIAGYEATYGGQAKVNGNNLSVDVAFAQVTYAITFTEVGLPSGTMWYLNVTGQSPVISITTTASIDLPNGTYSYTIATSDKEYAPSPASSSFKVSGVSLGQTVNFSLVKYTVTFTETGIQSGMEWYLNVTGQSPVPSTSTTASISLPNGTYSYTIATAYKQYEPSLTSSNFDISGTSLSETVTFRLVTSTVTFTETGLPSGTDWSIILSGAQHFSTGSIITFAELNDTYPYTVVLVAGYAASPSSGNVIVNGKAVSISIQFTTTSNGSGNTGTSILGMPAMEFYLVVVGIVVVVAAIAIVLLLLRRKKTQVTPPSPSPGVEPPKTES